MKYRMYATNSKVIGGRSVPRGLALNSVTVWSQGVPAIGHDEDAFIGRCGSVHSSSRCRWHLRRCEGYRRIHSEDFVALGGCDGYHQVSRGD
jgi:hypothetical protein